MQTQLRTMGLGLLVATVVSLCGATSTYAFPGQNPRVQPVVPPPVGSPVVPRLGIMGHMDRGWGMVVDSVVRGTTASRIGLERGDVILRINGQEITNDWTYRKALLHAVQFENGQLKMQIADVRSGRRVFRTGYLNANPGVIRPWSAPHADDDFGHHDHDHHGYDHHNQYGVGQSISSVSRTFQSTEW